MLISCIGKHKSNSQKATIKAPTHSSNEKTGDTLKVNLSNSSIHWKGTKMKGSGKHQGQIQLQDAFLKNSKGLLVGGHFTVDMNTIEVTDIPEHEPVPRKRFNDHMKSKDFFDTETVPISKFEITKVEHTTTDSLTITGNLTIKGITKSISFASTKKRKTFIARFTIDRFQWNIAYKGSWVNKTLVDKDIELTIELITE
jgi:polyisoprenoid-binding protein YceI